MEKRVIRCKIDVSKIDKSRLYKGEKGTYLKFSMLEQPTKYSDWMIVEDITSEERKSGKKGMILGNGNNVERKAESQTVNSDGIDEVLPF